MNFLFLKVKNFTNFNFATATTSPISCQCKFVEIMSAHPAASFKAFHSYQPEDNNAKKNTKLFTDALDNGNDERRTKNFTKELKSIFLH